MKSILSISLVMLLAGSAAADEPRRTRVDLAVGGAFLWHNVDTFTGNFDGYALDAGVRRGRHVVYASFQDYDDTTEDAGGTLRRAGLSLRHDRSDMYLQFHKAAIVVGPFFEAGAGYEWLRWMEDRRHARPDLSFGVGGSVRMGRRQHEVGMELGVRFLVAPAIDRDGVDAGGMFFAGIPFSP
jgi:hypothetical protein